MLKIMQREIENATSRYIQEEIIWLKAMWPEHLDVETDPLISLEPTLELDTMYILQFIRDEDT